MPFFSSSPILRRPTRGFSRWSTCSANTLPQIAKSYKFYRDAIQPESQNQLTKEILFNILDSYFKNNDIPLTYDSYAKFIKQNRVPIVVIDEDGNIIMQTETDEFGNFVFWSVVLFC